MQLLLIVLGLVVVAYGIWRWVGLLGSGGSGAAAELAEDPQHNLFNLLTLVMGFVLIGLGAIMSLGVR